MKKLIAVLIVVVTVLLACQKEPDFQLNPPAPIVNGPDTIKAVVFDGAIDPSVPALNYDSMVYDIQADKGAIRHYAPNGQVMWEELFTYDAQGRVTSHVIDYGYDDIYRLRHFDYTGTDTFPSFVVDSFNDGDLSVHLFNRIASAPVAGGTDLIYDVQYEVPTTGYGDAYQVTYSFFADGKLRSAKDDGVLSKREEHLYYTSDGLLDSIYFDFVSPSYQWNYGFKLTYTSYANPLATLGKRVYKNLYSYLPMSRGGFSHHFSISNHPDGMYAPRCPQSGTQFDTDKNVEYRYGYNYQVQNNQPVGLSIESYDFNFPPSTVTAVRIYK